MAMVDEISVWSVSPLTWFTSKLLLAITFNGSQVATENAFFKNWQKGIPSTCWTSLSVGFMRKGYFLICSSHLAHLPVQQMLHYLTHLRAFMLVFPLPGTRFSLPSKGFQLSITSIGRPSCPPCLNQCYLTPHHHPRLFSRLSSWNHLIGLSFSLPPALKHAPRKLGYVCLDYRVIPNDWISDWQKKKRK